LSRVAIFWTSGFFGRRGRLKHGDGLEQAVAGCALTISGQKELDANAIHDYFKPLEDWLNDQNAGRPMGW
jgi:hypothetical protein